MIVLLIIAVLVAIAVPLFNFSGEEAKKRACQSNLRTLDEAARRYYSDHQKWPSEAGWKTELAEYIKEEPRCPSHINKPYEFDAIKHYIIPKFCNI